eukprot:326524-Pleurochrysis_carterae.AAC.1
MSFVPPALLPPAIVSPSPLRRPRRHLLSRRLLRRASHDVQARRAAKLAIEHAADDAAQVERRAAPA